MRKNSVSDWLTLLSRTAGNWSKFIPLVEQLTKWLSANRTTAVWIVIILLLLVLLSGCAAPTKQPYQRLPPQAQPRPVPEYSGKTYRDVILHLIELRESNLSCEADKAVIRQVMEPSPAREGDK